jgi:hypothetical protein
VACVPQDRPRLGSLAGVGETYLIAAAQADLAPLIAEAVAIGVRAITRVGRRGARGQGQLQAGLDVPLEPTIVTWDEKQRRKPEDRFQPPA